MSTVVHDSGPSDLPDHADYGLSIVNHCGSLLWLLHQHRLQRASSHKADPEVQLVRRGTHTLWKAAYDRMQFQNPDPTSQPRMRRLIDLWIKLGQILEGWYPNETSTAVEPSFPPLSRCGWKGCLCNIYKPSHELHVCKRCWRVTYCNAWCQTKYVA